MQAANGPEYGGQTAFAVIADPSGAGAMVAAIAAAGGRARAPIGWAEAAGGPDLARGATGLAIDAAGATPDQLDRVLPVAAEWSRSDGLPVVVRFATDQLDHVAGALLGSGAILLCEPSPGESAAAFAVAVRPSATRSVRENGEDDEQLRRLNEEIARIAETLARLGRDPSSSTSRTDGLEDRHSGYGAAPLSTAASSIRAGEVRDAIRVRRLREQFFPAGLFEDPAWDMLLDLFAAELEGAQVSVSSLCIAAAVPATTALRWIGRMTAAGLLVRRPDPFDRRRAFVSLSRAASDGMLRYTAALRRAGLSLS